MRITDDLMTGDATAHSARRTGNGWRLSWLPARVLARDQAIIGMTIAETVARTEAHSGGYRWAHLDHWARELGLTGAYVAARVAQPPQLD